MTRHLLCLFALGLLTSACAMEPELACGDITAAGEVRVESARLRDDGDSLWLEYRVANGTAGDIYVADSLTHIAYDDEARRATLTIQAPRIPEDTIHVALTHICYQRVPPGCSLRRVLSLNRSYEELDLDALPEQVSTTLPLHEAEAVDLIVAWGEEAPEASEDAVTYEAYPTWVEERQGERSAVSFSREPGADPDASSEPTPSTRCYRHFF